MRADIARTALAMNSGPLSDRTWLGTPRRINRSVRTSIAAVEPALSVDPDGQALPGERVDDIQHAERPAVMGPALDDVAEPDVVCPRRAEADA